MLMSCGIIYLIFAKSEVQPWNDPESMKKRKQDAEKPTTEMEPLKAAGDEDEKTPADEEEPEEEKIKN